MAGPALPPLPPVPLTHAGEVSDIAELAASDAGKFPRLLQKDAVLGHGL